jgi:hypothetical protein
LTACAFGFTIQTKQIGAEALGDGLREISSESSFKEIKMLRTKAFLLTFCLLIGISAVASAKHPSLLVGNGSVTSINLAPAGIVVKGKHHGTQTFTLAPGARIDTLSGAVISFGAIKVHDIVRVRYKVSGTTLLASHITVLGHGK